MKPRKKRCRICGQMKPVEIIERVNGIERCYACGKRARAEEKNQAKGAKK